MSLVFFHGAAWDGCNMRLVGNLSESHATALPRKIFITALQFETAAEGNIWRGPFLSARSIWWDKALLHWCFDLVSRKSRRLATVFMSWTEGTFLKTPILRTSGLASTRTLFAAPGAGYNPLTVDEEVVSWWKLLEVMQWSCRKL